MARYSRSKIRDEEEIRVFRDFCGISDLAIVLDSIEKRQPPEPDILCRSEGGGMLAFELVELCHRNNASLFGKMPLVARAIEEAYRNIPNDWRDCFTSRFANRPLSFRFAPDASLNRIRGTLPRIFAELLDLPEKDGQFDAFSKAVQKALISVQLVGRVDEPGRPSFNIAGSFQPEDVVVECVHRKLNRNYETPHPVELLAYFGARAWGRSTTWQSELKDLLQSIGLGPFRRIWILGWNGIDFVYPSSDAD